MKNRIVGIDIARALAIFGMIIVNFKIVLYATDGNSYLLSLTSILEGRASALFVILAGIGLSLNKDSKKIFKRGLLLIFIGLLYTPIWPADILHFYGFYFIIASFFLNKKSILLSIIAIFLFPILFLFFDYSYNWNWITFTYSNFWTFDGIFRHIFFNGFHPVIPWIGFLFFGIWLGDNIETLNKKKLLYLALFTLFLVEITFFILRNSLTNILTLNEIEFLLSTSPIPPMPQYMLSAIASSVIIILFSLKISKYKNLFLKILEDSGKLSLTIYISHIIIGLGLLEAFGKLEKQSIEFAFIYALIFFSTSAIFSHFWLKKFKYGVLEYLFKINIRI